MKTNYFVRRSLQVGNMSPSADVAAYTARAIARAIVAAATA